jgi:colanic acid biosynthesis glycosyl transferase WcaI
VRIALVTPYFPPEVGSASHLFYELGRELARRGHAVHVATLMPRYMVRDLPARYRGRRLMRERVDGMLVSRVWAPSLPRGRAVARGIDQFVQAAAVALAGARGGRADAILQYSPPLPIGLASLALARAWGAPFVLNVQDLFPQSAIDLGVLKQPVLIRAYEALETLLYRRASQVTVHSRGNAEHVAGRGVPRERISVLDNWVDVDHVRPGDRHNGFRARHGLDDAFVVSFGGVLGYSQDLDVVLEAADRLRDERRIVWLIVGDGVEKARLEEKARRLALEHVRFLPMLPRDEYPELLAASDVGLATLRGDVRTPVVPSKIPSIMASGRPVVAALDQSGDAPKLIAVAEAGVSLPPGDADALADTVRRLSRDPALCARLGANGRRYVEAELSLGAAAARYEELFARLLAARSAAHRPILAAHT